MKANLTIKPQKSYPIIILLIPVFHLIALILLSYWGAKTGYSKINSQRAAIASAKKAEVILSEKESTLKSAASDILKYINPSVIALPDKNPALFLISQVKNLSEQNSLSLNEFKIGMGGQSGKSNINLSFTLQGGYREMYNFFIGSGNIAPILTIQKLEMSLISENANCDVTMNSYWSEFPEKLPPISDPINKLTTENYNTLSYLISLSPPFFSTLTPSEPIQRDNPFF